MSRRRTVLAGLAAAAAGAAAGVAIEEVLYRRLLRRPDPEADEPIGTIPAERVEVESFDGTTLARYAYGPRDPSVTLVCAHGVIESHVVWHYLVRDLTPDGVRIVAFDARGHGASGPARGPLGETPYTFAAQARDLAAVVEGATSGRVVLVGHSMGGMAIQALWQDGTVDPIRRRLAGAVLVNTAYTADLRGWRGRGTRGERAFERIEDVFQQIPWGGGLIERVRPGRSDLTLLAARVVYGKDPSPKHLRTSVRMFEGTASETIGAAIELAHFDAYDALPHIDVPVLVVAGNKDVITPLWLSEEICARVPDAELVVLDGCGHIAPFERHADLATHVRKFLARL